jgi:5-formyltetrahydrofolate cyclo-ligase
MADSNVNKAELRRELRLKLASMSPEERQAKSLAAVSLLVQSPEFAQARMVMLYLSTPQEVDTAPLALKCWQAGKTVCVPKVSWDQRRMLPTEITSLQVDMRETRPGIREPMGGKPCPVQFIDLVIVPGLGFSPRGYRIGRGMGFYDRFLAQDDFLGVSCGLAFESQVVEDIPVLDHDIPLGMLVTDRGVRRFASNCIEAR